MSEIWRKGLAEKGGELSGGEGGLKWELRDRDHRKKRGATWKKMEIGQKGGRHQLAVYKKKEKRSLKIVLPRRTDSWKGNVWRPGKAAPVKGR